LFNKVLIFEVVWNMLFDFWNLAFVSWDFYEMSDLIFTVCPAFGN